MADDDERMQVAQNTRPNIYDDAAKKAGSPAETTPGGTPIKRLDQSSDNWLKREAPPVKERTDEERKASAQKRKDTMTMDQFEVTNLIPKGQQDFESWSNSLSPKHLRMAKELEDYYKSKGYKGGWFDPTMTAQDKKLREFLFKETSGHWHESRKPKGAGAPPDTQEDKSNKGTPTPEQFFGGKKRSELKPDAGAIGNLGGNYMGDV